MSLGSSVIIRCLVTCDYALFSFIKRNIYSTAADFWHLFTLKKLKSIFIISIFKPNYFINLLNPNILQTPYSFPLKQLYKSYNSFYLQTKSLESSKIFILQIRIDKMTWQYGWNAQSALLPEKSKEIKVCDKGNQKIKAAILLSKQKIKNLPQIKGLLPTPAPKQQIKRNKGIQQRMKRDQQAKQLQNSQSTKSLAFIKHQLQKKQKIYQQISKNPKNHSLFMVDFVQKQLSQQDQQLQQLKKSFYAGKLQQIIQQQQKIHQSDEKDVHQHMRENLAWEKEVLQELNGEIISGKAKVAQSFDRKLTENEKAALSKVIQERIKDKQRISQLKKQRQLENEERIRKLRKLDILEDSEEEQLKGQEKKK